MPARFYKDQNGVDMVDPGSGMAPFPAKELMGERAASADSPVLQHLMNPEMLAAIASMVIAPEGAAARYGVPAAVGGATSVGRDLMAGERDPMTLLAHGAEHAGLSAIPGAVEGAWAKLPGRVGIADALEVGSRGKNFVGSIQGMLSSLIRPAAEEAGAAAVPAAAAASTKMLPAPPPAVQFDAPLNIASRLKQMLTGADLGGLSAAGQKTVASRTALDRLRAILAGESEREGR